MNVTNPQRPPLPTRPLPTPGVKSSHQNQNTPPTKAADHGLTAPPKPKSSSPIRTNETPKPKTFEEAIGVTGHKQTTLQSALLNIYDEHKDSPENFKNAIAKYEQENIQNRAGPIKDIFADLKMDAFKYMGIKDEPKSNQTQTPPEIPVQPLPVAPQKVGRSRKFDIDPAELKVLQSDLKKLAPTETLLQASTANVVRGCLKPKPASTELQDLQSHLGAVPDLQKMNASILAAHDAQLAALSNTPPASPKITQPATKSVESPRTNDPQLEQKIQSETIHLKLVGDKPRELVAVNGNLTAQEKKAAMNECVESAQKTYTFVNNYTYQDKARYELRNPGDKGKPAWDGVVPAAMTLGTEPKDAIISRGIGSVGFAPIWNSSPELAREVPKQIQNPKVRLPQDTSDYKYNLSVETYNKMCEQAQTAVMNGQGLTKEQAKSLALGLAGIVIEATVQESCGKLLGDDKADATIHKIFQAGLNLGSELNSGGLPLGLLGSHGIKENEIRDYNEKNASAALDSALKNKSDVLVYNIGIGTGFFAGNNPADKKAARDANIDGIINAVKIARDSGSQIEVMVPNLGFSDKERKQLEDGGVTIVTADKGKLAALLARKGLKVSESIASDPMVILGIHGPGLWFLNQGPATEEERSAYHSACYAMGYIPMSIQQGDQPPQTVSALSRFMIKPGAAKVESPTVKAATPPQAEVKLTEIQQKAKATIDQLTDGGALRDENSWWMIADMKNPTDQGVNIAKKEGSQDTYTFTFSGRKALTRNPIARIDLPVRINQEGKICASKDDLMKITKGANIDYVDHEESETEYIFKNPSAVLTVVGLSDYAGDSIDGAAKNIDDIWQEKMS